MDINEKVDKEIILRVLKLMEKENIAFEDKKGKIEPFFRIMKNKNTMVYGKSLASWAKVFGDENWVNFMKEKEGVENQISKKESEELGKQFWNKSGKLKSVKEIKELVFMGADLSVKNHNNEQIWKNLSFEEMNEVLKDLPRGYVIDGDVDLSHRGLTELPDFSKIKVGGYFDCSWNQLTTLEGAPEKVGRDFDCSGNQLTDLKGAPSEVGESFYCSHNQLTDLKGAPSEVEGGFYCSVNKLTTLQGAPEKVGRGFDCGKNQLTDLRGAPREVGGAFYCSENQLISLEGKPLKIGGEFAVIANMLKEEELKPKKENGEEKRIDLGIFSKIWQKSRG